MRSIHVNSLKGEEILAKSIYDENGRVLLRSGTVIRSNYIKKIQDIGLEYLYIQDEISDGIQVEDVISEETRQEGKKEIKKVFKDYFVSEKLELTKVYELVSNIIDEILNNKQRIINMTDIRNKNEMIYEHCINVCVLATSVGAYVFDVKRLKELTLGAIMHDFGLMFVPEDIIDKPDELTKEENDLIKSHPQVGYEILATDMDFPLIARNIVYMHHEMCDGSGYPLGVKAKQIHDATKLVTICDMFDVMLTPKLSKKQMKTYESFETLSSMVGTKIDKRMFQHFSRHVALYPVGKCVRLSNDYIGIVAAQNSDLLLRPIVRMIYDDRGNRIDPVYDLDLSKELTLFITDIVEV